MPNIHPRIHHIHIHRSILLQRVLGEIVPLKGTEGERRAVRDTGETPGGGDGVDDVGGVESFGFGLGNGLGSGRVEGGGVFLELVDLTGEVVEGDDLVVFDVGDFGGVSDLLEGGLGERPSYEREWRRLA